MTFLEKITLGEEQFDLLILSCSKEEESSFWQHRLSQLFPAVITVTEEWGEGGAGNALGTLHAIQKAEKAAKKLKIPSPLTLLKKGGKVALYHAAGKGTRMAPLTQAEGGMKSAIKLPAYLPNGQGPLSVLEMVIRQTAPLSSLSVGRLSVFWTDQLFLPSSLSWEAPKGDVEVLSIALPNLDKELFAEKKLSHYGLWGDEQYFDKLILKHFEKLSGDKLFAGSINLGSFSISHPFLEELLSGYKKELEEQKGKLDSDPDWWMVATLPPDLYVQLKGEGKKSHYDRFKKLSKGAKVLPRVLGAETDWWDFGTVDNYRKQLFKLLSKTDEARRLQKLFGIKESHFQGNSLVFDSELEQCELNNSILVHVQGKKCHFDHSLAFDTSLSGGVLSHALLYGISKT